MTVARPDPQLEELSEAFGEDWRVWRPGRYVADHRWLDVTLVSDTVAELGEKLRRFITMTEDLPLTSGRAREITGRPGRLQTARRVRERPARDH